MDKFEEEMAKAAGQIAVDTASDTRRAIGAILGDGLRELGLTWGDNMRLYRFKNLIDIMDKVEAIRRARGLTPDQMQALPFGESFRVVEGASLEEEGEVQELWARLIANATDPESGVSAKKLYVDILKSLSANEATFLDLLIRFGTETIRTPAELKRFNQLSQGEFEKRWRCLPEEERHAVIQNLLRLRCVTIRLRPVNTANLLARVPRELLERSFSDWGFVDVKKFEVLLNNLTEQIAISGGAMEFVPTKGVPLRGWGSFPPPTIEAPELNYKLTSLGRSLMAACSLDGSVGGEVSAA